MKDFPVVDLVMLVLLATAMYSCFYCATVLVLVSVFKIQLWTRCWSKLFICSDAV